MKCLYSYSLLGKTGSVFGKNSVRFWEKSFRFWEKQALFLEKTCSAFGTKWFRFGAKLAWCFDWLGTKLKSHKFGFGFSRFRTGCLQNKSTGSKLEG